MTGSRRLLLAGVLMMAVLTGGVAAQSDAPTIYGVVANEGSPPVPDGQYLGQWDEYRFVYINLDDGARHVIKTGDSDWSELLTHLKHFNASEIPPSGATEGTIVWDTDRKQAGWYDGVDTEYPVVGNDVLTQTNSVENTVTETEVYSASIDEGSMETGRVYRLDIYGNYSTNDGSDTFTLRVHVGDTEVAAFTSVAENVNGAPITVKLRFTVRSTGSSGTVMVHTEAIFDDVHQDNHHGMKTLDTEQATTLNATVEWNVAEAGDVVHISQGYMEEMN